MKRRKHFGLNASHLRHPRAGSERDSDSAIALLFILRISISYIYEKVSSWTLLVKTTRELEIDGFLFFISIITLGPNGKLCTEGRVLLCPLTHASIEGSS